MFVSIHHHGSCHNRDVLQHLFFNLSQCCHMGKITFKIINANKILMRWIHVIFWFRFSLIHILKELISTDLSFPHIFMSVWQFCRKWTNTFLQSEIAVSLITLIGLISDPIISDIKGCHLINKKFGIDSFLNCKGLHLVFGNRLYRTHHHSRSQSSAC